jgi:hypothetical protein
MVQISSSQHLVLLLATEKSPNFAQTRLIIVQKKAITHHASQHLGINWLPERQTFGIHLVQLLKGGYEISSQLFGKEMLFKWISRGGAQTGMT